MAQTGEEDPQAAEHAYRRRVESNMETILDTVRSLAQRAVGGDEEYGERDEVMSTTRVGDVGHYGLSGLLAHSVG